MSDLYSPSPGQVSVEMELLFQLQRLVPRVRLSRPFRLLAAVCVRDRQQSYKMNDPGTRCNCFLSPHLRQRNQSTGGEDGEERQAQQQTASKTTERIRAEKHAQTSSYFRRIYSVLSSRDRFEACSHYCCHSHCLMVLVEQSLLSSRNLNHLPERTGEELPVTHRTGTARRSGRTGGPVAMVCDPQACTCNWMEWRSGSGRPADEPTVWQRRGTNAAEVGSAEADTRTRGRR